MRNLLTGSVDTLRDLAERAVDLGSTNKIKIDWSIGLNEKDLEQHKLSAISSAPFESSIKVVFSSAKQRPSLMMAIKDYINEAGRIPVRQSYRQIISFSQMSQFDAYLDRVEELPEELRAVTLLLSLDMLNINHNDFEHNLAIAKEHAEVWRGKKVYSHQSAGLFLTPLYGTKGEEAWRAFGKFVWMDHDLNRLPVLENFRDETYRKLVNFLVMAPDTVFESSNTGTIREHLHTSYKTKETQDRRWVAELPLWDLDLAHELTELTPYEAKSLALDSDWLKISREAVLHNIRGLVEHRDYSFRQFDLTRKRILLSCRKPIALSSEREKDNSHFFDQRRGMFKMLIDCLESISDPDEVWETYENARPIFFNDGRSWHDAGPEVDYYLLHNLAEAVGSTQKAIQILNTAAMQKVMLSIEDWENIIARYEEVEGVDLAIAAQLVEK